MTGLAHVQLAGLRPEDVDWDGRSIWVRGRQKGRLGQERKGHRKPITDEAITALRRVDALNCWGEFSRSSRRQSLQRACRRVQERLRRDGVTIELTRVARATFALHIRAD